MSLRCANLAVVVGLCAGLVGCFVGFVVAAAGIRTDLVEVLETEGHRAELIRRDHFVDRNYTLLLDGKTIYRSDDFVPQNRFPSRETLLWDKSGDILILEIARHRLFGYRLSTGMAVSDSELLAAELPPEGPLSDYTSMKWPGQ